MLENEWRYQYTQNDLIKRRLIMLEGEVHRLQIAFFGFAIITVFCLALLATLL